MYHDMGDEFVELSSSLSVGNERVRDVHVGNLLVRVHDDEVDRIFVTNVEGTDFVFF